MVLLCCVNVQLKAEELTVNDGTTTNEYVPIRGYYADTSGKSQFIVPSGSLSDMANGTITGVSFYSNYDFSFTGTWQVKLKEASGMDLSSAFVDDSDAGLVYEGTIAITSGVATITFDEGFPYEGADLLVEVYLKSTGNYSPSGSLKWYGVTAASGASRYNGGAVAFLPKATFTYTPGVAPSCEKPEDISITGLGATSVTLNWAGGGSGIYNVDYKKKTDDKFTSLLANSSETSITLSNLLPSTEYIAQVNCVCGEESFSSYKSVSFTTDCADWSISEYGSWSEDFESYTGAAASATTGGELNSCWLTSGTTYPPHVASSGSYGYYPHSGTKALTFYGGHCYAAVPHFVEALNTLRISFWARMESSSNGTLKLGYITDPGDFSTFVPIDVIPNKQTHQQYEYWLDTLPAAAERLVFEWNYTGQYSCCIDDITVSSLPACWKPRGLKELAGKATSGSIQIDWTPASPASSGENLWKVLCKKSADSDWGDPIDASTHPFTITGLDKYTSYDIRVAGYCTPDGSDPELSDYCDAITAKTAAGVPFEQNFNASSLPSDWKRYTGLWEEIQNGGELEAVSSGWSTVYKTYANANGVFPDSTYHLYLNIAGTSCKQWLVSPTIEMEAGYQLTFNLALTPKSATSPTAVTAGAQNDDQFILAIYDDENGWTAVRTWDNSGTFDNIKGTAGGEIIKVDLSSYADKAIQIAFYGESTEANGDNNLHIQNVKIAAIPACENTTSLEASEVSVTTASLVWAQEEGATWEYYYQVKPTEEFTPADGDFISTTGYSVDLTSLSENTGYVFYLRRACSETEHSAIRTLEFKTFPSPKEIPWTENFNAAGFPEHWDNSEGTAYNKWSKYLVSTGDSCMRFDSYNNSNGNTGILATPRIDLSKAAILSFDWKNPAGGAGEVLISTDNGATRKSLLSTGLTGVSSWTPFEINLSDYEGQKVIIYFKGTSNYEYGDAYLYLDNVKVDVAPDCIKPNGLRLVEVTENSASLQWEDDSNANPWAYAYAPADAEEPELTAYTDIDQLSVVISGLPYNTAYIFYLRKHCGESYSDAISVPFKTVNPYQITINDGTTTNSYVPIYGSWADDYIRSQFIIPAATLDAIAWDTITNLTFYSSTANVTWGVAEFEVYMAEVTNTTFSSTSYVDWSSLTKVMNAGSLSIVDGEMSVALDEPFVYKGGNLLIGFYQTVEGSYLGCSWLGVSATGASLGGYSSTAGVNGSPSQQGFLPKMAIEFKEGERPACVKPSALDTTAVTTNSIAIEWTPGSLEQYWFVQYKKASASEWTYVPDSVKTPSYTITGLDASSVYNIRVASWCNPEDSTDVTDYCAPITVATECAAIAYLSEDFESAGSLPCWNRITETNSYGTFPGVATYEDYAASGTNFLYFLSYADGTPTDQYMILPEINTLEGKRIRFNARKEDDTDEDTHAVVGVMTDPADASTFQYLDSIAMTSTTYAPFVVPFTAYTGAGKYIAIAMPAAQTGYATLLVDDIVIEDIPSCVEASGLAVDSIGATMAVLKWDNVASGAWKYALSSDAEPADEAFVAVTDTFVLVNGLTSNTQYVFYLRHDCGSGVLSPSISISFKTSIIAPWSENFEEMTAGAVPEYWDNSASGSSTLSSYPEYVWGVYTYGGNKMIRMNNYYVKSGTALINTPRIVLPNEPAYLLAFDYAHTATCGNLSVNVSDDNGATWATLGSYGKTSTGTDYANPGAFESAEINLGAYAGKTISLQFFADANYGNGAIFVDNVDIHEVPACAKPSALDTTAVTTNSIAIEWTPGSLEQYWFVQYKKASASEWSYVPDSVKTPSYTITGLDASSTYNIRVASWCNPEDSTDVTDYCTPITIATECATISSFPWSENFDGLSLASAYTPSEQVLPICWSAINTCTHSDYKNYPTVYYYSYTNYSNSTPNCLRFYSYYSTYTNYDPQDQYAILPEMEGVSGLRMKFNARAYSTGSSYDATFVVGVMSDPADTATFVPVQTFNPTTTSYEPFEIRFNAYAGAGQYIAIKMEKANATKTYRGFFIDDIVIDPIPNCDEATGLAIDTIGANMAVLYWDNIASGAWKYAYALASAAEPADEAFVAVTDTFVQVNGLTDNAQYKFYLRHDCGSSASPSISVSFQTKQLPIAIGSGFIDDFEGTNNWYYINSTKHGWVIGEAAHTGVGTHAMYVSKDEGATNSYNNSGTNIVYATKAFTFDNGSYSFHYNWLGKGEGASYDWDYMRVALVPASAKLTAGTIPSGFTQNSLPSGWIALDNGSLKNLQDTWQELTTAEIPVTAGEYKVVFAWKNDGSAGSDPAAAVDNFSISKVTCAKPSALTCASKTAHTASMTWKLGQDGQTSWQFAVDTISGFNPDTLTSKLVVDADSAYILSGLKANKNYYAYLRAICGVGDTSAWSSKASFKTLVGNQVPTNVAVENSSLTAESAKICWKVAASNDLHESFDVYYSLFNNLPAELNSDSLILGIQDTCYIFNALSANTTYYVWVRDNCGADGYSAWTSSSSFTTLANCPVPGDLSISNIEGHTADLAWAIGTNDSYNVRYRVSGDPQVIFSEGFESAIDAWTLSDCHTSTGVSSSAGHSGSKGFSFRWSTNPPQYLISPEISGAIAGATLEFWYKNYSSSNPETFQIGLSATDNAVASFAFGEELTVADMQWHQYSATIPAGTKYICFKYTSNDKYYLYVDDIVITVPTEAGEWHNLSNITEKHVQLTGMDPETKYEAQVQGVCGSDETEWSDLINFTTIESCVVPSNLTISEVAKHSAKLSWQSNASAWEICLNNDLENLIAVAALDTPYVLTNLKGDSLYTVKVRANCGSEDGDSEWSASQSFTTLLSCEVPSSLKVSDISAHGAKLDWNSSASAWEICLNGDLAHLIQVEGDSTYTFSGLNAGTAYSVKVRAICGGEDGESRWSAVKSFNTECENISVFPWSENFNKLTSGIPLCWDNSEGTTTDASYKWTRYANEPDTCLRFNSYSNSNGKTNILATPTFELSAGLELAFDWKNPAGGAGEVLISKDGGATKTSLYSDLTGIANWREIEIDLSAYAGETVTIYFKATSNWGSNDAYLYLDNVAIKPLPTCRKPTEFKVSDVKAHSAELSWKAGADEQAWQIAIDSVDFKPDTLSAAKLAEILRNVTDTPYVVTGLDTVTTYYVYVRANCGGEDVSKWSDKKSFKTTIACPAPTGFKAYITPGSGTIAGLKWNGDAESYTVQYGTDNTFADGTYVELDNLQNDTVALAGLTAEATYYARVKAVCGGIDGESKWSNIVSFVPTNKYELLVNDGTSTNEFVPVYGYYADNLTRSQFIIPATSLEAIQWDTIKHLTFYTSSPASVDLGAATFEVFVAEVDETTFASTTLYDWAEMDTVMAAGSLTVSGNKMEVEFTKPYQYQDGNLMIGFKQGVKGNDTHTYWYGVTATGASLSGYQGSSLSISQRNFLPKMLITYVPGIEPACKDPKHLTLDDVTAHSATFSWGAQLGANWQYAVAPASEQPDEFEATTANSVEVINLNELTDYVFYLRRNCGEDGFSNIISLAFTTEAHITTVPFADDFEGANYWKLVNGSMENAWVIGSAVANDGNRSLYISNDGGQNNTYNGDAQAAVFATLLIRLDKDSTYVFQYDWRCEGEYYEEDGALDYMRVAIVPATVETAAGLTPPDGFAGDALPAGWIALDGGQALVETDAWQHVSVDKALTAGDYKVVIAWVNDEADAGETAAAIDNFSIAYKPGQATGFNDGLIDSDKAVKFIRNNHVYILVNGRIYDATGRRVK